MYNSSHKTPETITLHWNVTYKYAVSCHPERCELCLATIQAITRVRKLNWLPKLACQPPISCSLDRLVFDCASWCYVMSSMSIHILLLTPLACRGCPAGLFRVRSSPKSQTTELKLWQHRSVMDATRTCPTSHSHPHIYRIITCAATKASKIFTCNASCSSLPSFQRAHAQHDKSLRDNVLTHLWNTSEWSRQQIRVFKLSHHSWMVFLFQSIWWGFPGWGRPFRTPKPGNLCALSYHQFTCVVSRERDEMNNLSICSWNGDIVMESTHPRSLCLYLIVVRVLPPGCNLHVVGHQSPLRPHVCHSLPQTCCDRVYESHDIFLRTCRLGAMTTDPHSFVSTKKTVHGLPEGSCRQ